MDKLNLFASNNSLQVEESDHPNKMPFSGTLTYFDIPSNKPVGGSQGYKVVIPSEYGVPALDSLKGMAVNCDPMLMDKHVSDRKIGIIEDAWAGEKDEAGGTPVFVKGYIYKFDFPDEAQTVKEEQANLGFSYETIDTPVEEGIYEGEKVLYVCGPMVFSGAAILLKDKGAYTTTNLVANAEEENRVDLDELVAKIIEAIDSKYDLKAKEEKPAEEEKPMEEDMMAEKEEPAKEVPQEEEKEAPQEEAKEEPQEKEEDLEAEKEQPAEEPKEEEKEEDKEDEAKATLKAMADTIETLKSELASFKAEAQEKFLHERKSVEFPTTLAAKYDFKASADSYEEKIKAVDARTDLNVDQRLALKFELRDAQRKALRQ